MSWALGLNSRATWLFSDFKLAHPKARQTKKREPGAAGDEAIRRQEDTLPLEADKQGFLSAEIKSKVP